MSFEDTCKDYTDEEIEYATNMFMSDIISLRKIAAVTPVKCEPVYLTEAAEMCTVAVTGNNVSNLLALQEEKDKMEQEDWLSKHMGHLIAVLALMGLPIIGYMVINH